jgi:hypothetical protein
MGMIVEVLGRASDAVAMALRAWGGGMSKGMERNTSHFGFSLGFARFSAGKSPLTPLLLSPGKHNITMLATSHPLGVDPHPHDAFLRLPKSTLSMQSEVRNQTRESRVRLPECAIAVHMGRVSKPVLAGAM